MARLRTQPQVTPGSPTGLTQSGRRTYTAATAKVEAYDTPDLPSMRDMQEPDSAQGNELCSEPPRTARKLVLKKTPSTARTKQIRLGPLASSRRTADDDILPRNERLSRPTPRRFLQLREQPSKRLNKIRADTTPSASEAEDSDSNDDEESIEISGTDEEHLDQISNADSDVQDMSLRPKQAPAKQPSSQAGCVDLARELQALNIMDSMSATNLTPSKKPVFKIGQRHHRSDSASDKENVDAIIHFTPPTIRTISKGETRLKTPPPLTSPSKGRLQSPSKRQMRIPTPPGRPSLGAFWAADAVNDWNDRHSPQKVLKSPRKLKFLPLDSDDEEDAEAPVSPRKIAKDESPSRRTFNATKHELAASFLQELDEKITDGRVSQLTASTGGIQLTWSKTLNKTAGRAHWRREHTKVQSTAPDESTDENGRPRRTSKDFVSIELAEKIITDEARLLNTLAHEFCHIANYVISNVRDHPHGAEFKRWGRLCTQTFGHRGVEVTTKHTYEIEFKYIWQCSSEDCGVEFKRHSKSIDPARHTCGSCHARLVQIKPVPRKTAAATSGQGGAGGGYAGYVKQHFAEVKSTCPPGTSQKDIMVAIGKKYRAEKQAVEMTAVTDFVAAPGEADEKEASVAVIELDDIVSGMGGISLAVS